MRRYCHVAVHSDQQCCDERWRVERIRVALFFRFLFAPKLEAFYEPLQHLTRIRSATAGGWHEAGISEQSLNYLARNQNIFIEQIHRAHSMITVSDNDSAITLVSDEENGRKLFPCR